MLNKVFLIGRLTAKPTLTNNQSNFKLTKFSIAVNRAGNRNSGADFLNIVAFEKTAENICNYLDKGSLILVEGRISVSSYVNNENKKIFRTEIIANSVRFLESGHNYQQPVQNTNNFAYNQQRPIINNQNEQMDALANEMLENFQTQVSDSNFNYSSKVENSNNEIFADEIEEEIQWEK